MPNHSSSGKTKQRKARTALVQFLNKEVEMLVLTRKLGEKICIGNDIVLTIVEIERGKIKLGIVAPDEVRIYREEVYNKHIRPKDDQQG